MTSFQEWERCDELCFVSEFEGYLQNPDISSKLNLCGWVFSKNFEQTSEFPTQEQKDNIQCVMEAVTSELANLCTREHMLQFWGIKEGCCSLTTVDQPFAVVGPLYKGQSWYRKLCEANQYSQKVGPVGRVYLNRKPESTPDLRLYTVEEFPLRNEAAKCGLRTYLALPLFDLQTQKCYGVLEIVSAKIGFDPLPIHTVVDQVLKEAGLRSTHTGFSSIIFSLNESTCHQLDEVTKMMKSAMELVPQLHLVQVWSPCKQCVVNTSNNLSCMRRIAFINSKDNTLNFSTKMHLEMFEYLEASRFHNLQIGKWIGGPLMSVAKRSCFCRNICDFNIHENPLAHYAQRARLSFCFVVLLQNVHNQYMVEFFFQSNSREDDSFLHLLLKIMEMELTNFKFEKSVVELRKTSALGYEYVEWKHQHSHLEKVNMLMKGHRERYSLSDFKNYLQNADLCYWQPCAIEKHRWLFWREEISDNGVDIPMQEKIKKLMTEIATEWVWRSYCLVQFWGLGMNEGKPCLQTFDQPFFLGSLDKGLAFFRKQCMNCQYFVDEEVGPLQRVFRSVHPETSPDLRLYSVTEFPLRDHALYCHLRTYTAFPILDQHKKCIGVLEYIGDDDDYFSMIQTIDDYFSMIQTIQRALQAASLFSTHINFMTNPTLQVDGSRRLAENEICRVLELFKTIPQVYHVEVWVTYNECDGITSNISCMELFQSTLGKQTNFRRRVQTGKGIVGMALASQNKLFFCRHSSDFSIADEPFAHYSRHNRLDVCFAICLQSSHTGDLLYVLEFFLDQGPATYEYLSSFLHVIFPILKQELTSFEVASGQQMGDDLEVNVIGFSQGNQLISFELDESHSPPFKFKYVVYGQKEPQHSNNELPHSAPDVMDSVPTVPPERPSNAAASGSREKGIAKEKVGRKRNCSLHIRLEDLEPHFGKKIEHVAQELGVARSTIKRACRFHGIDRWPSSEKYIKNRRLFEAAGTSDDNRSRNVPPRDMSLPPTNDKTSLQLVCDLQPESETVIVKARYEDEIIKFELRRLSSSMKNLQEEVGRRLDLEIGSFKLRYLDEDNDKILLACDDDLQLFFKSLTAGDKATMQLFVQLIQN